MIPTRARPSAIALAVLLAMAGCSGGGGVSVGNDADRDPDAPDGTTVPVRLGFLAVGSDADLAPALRPAAAAGGAFRFDRGTLDIQRIDLAFASGDTAPGLAQAGAFAVEATVQTRDIAVVSGYRGEITGISLTAAGGIQVEVIGTFIDPQGATTATLLPAVVPSPLWLALGQPWSTRDERGVVLIATIEVGTWLGGVGGLLSECRLPAAAPVTPPIPELPAAGIDADLSAFFDASTCTSASGLAAEGLAGALSIDTADD